MSLIMLDLADVDDSELCFFKDVFGWRKTYWQNKQRVRYFGQDFWMNARESDELLPLTMNRKGLIIKVLYCHLASH